MQAIIVIAAVVSPSKFRKLFRFHLRAALPPDTHVAEHWSFQISYADNVKCNAKGHKSFTIVFNSGIAFSDWKYLIFNITRQVAATERRPDNALESFVAPHMH